MTIEKSERLYALDAFRGLTIAMMILVNNPGSWAHIYAPLEHASWNGCTPTDLVFPFFLFIVGVAMWFSFGKYDHQANPEVIKKVVKRTILIYVIGALLALFPYFGFFGHSLSHFRILGVFPRIALAYGGASFIVLYMKEKHVKYTAVGILLGYWLLMYLFGGSDPYAIETNLARKIDLVILGANHMWHGHGLAFDPEGILSTFPSIVTVIFGYFTGKLITGTKDRALLVNEMFWYAVPLLFVGLIWNNFFPINKSIWTSSFVIYTAGWALLTLAFMILLIDVKGYKKLVQPFVVFGTNPLFVFSLSVVWVKTIAYIIKWTLPDGTTMTGYKWIYQHVFQSWAGDLNGSLFFALGHVIIFWFILLILYRKNIIIKI